MLSIPGMSPLFVARSVPNLPFFSSPYMSVSNFIEFLVNQSANHLCSPNESNHINEEIVEYHVSDLPEKTGDCEIVECRANVVRLDCREQENKFDKRRMDDMINRLGILFITRTRGLLDFLTTSQKMRQTQRSWGGEMAEVRGNLGKNNGK